MRAKIINVTTHAPNLSGPVKQPQTGKLGLGDVVAAIAQPIAKAVDSVAGSKIATCKPCSQRQAKLNAFLPDLLKPFRK